MIYNQHVMYYILLKHKELITLPKASNDHLKSHYNYNAF